MIATVQQIIPTFLQYLNNANFGHWANEKSNGKSIVDNINQDLEIFPETYVGSPDSTLLSSVFGFLGMR
jgi:hypothetical protein